MLLNRNETYRELLVSSIKSDDTEEWLDVHFTRHVGLVMALVGRRLKVHPNAITIASMFIGVASGYMFAHADLMSNIFGILLLMTANFCDSADGQLARLTGQKTDIGRALDGVAGDVWFTAIYIAIIVRLWCQPIPFLTMEWGPWIFILTAISSLLFHSPQAGMADYYRQIHLFFLKGREGSELSTSAAQLEAYRNLPQGREIVNHIYYKLYANYCRSQEKKTPQFQLFYSRYQSFQDASLRASIRERFLEGSRPLMKWTNILTFNCRAITLYVSFLIGMPYLYLIAEITVFTAIYWHMHRTHERLSSRLTQEISAKEININHTNQND